MRAAIAITPWALTGAYIALLSHPTTFPAMYASLRENSIVELLTVAFLGTSGVLGLVLANRLRRRGSESWASVFYAVLATGLLLTAMEEIAWGQALIPIETPAAWRRINEQGELTLHNHPLLHARTEYLRLAFGIGGLIGITIWSRARWSAVAVPPILASWFFLIAMLAALDAANLEGLVSWYSWVFDVMSELTELMIGMAAFLYVTINGGRLGLGRGE